MNGSRVPIAIVHHANQYLIANDYRNRAGLAEIIGPPNASSGLRAVFELHSMYRIPFNLHISGTFIEACAWLEPHFLEEISEMVDYGLIEVLGSTYAQNIMPLFEREHNLYQIREELDAIEAWLGVHPTQITGFWIPERVWNTERLSPVLTDSTLGNGGFRYILADDRLLVPKSERYSFDQNRPFRPELFEAYDIRGGNGLIVLPLSGEMRLNIPLETVQQERKLDTLMARLTEELRNGRNIIAIYGDDMEKAAGIPPWNPLAVKHYRRFLQWVVRRQDAYPVQLNAWLTQKALRPTGCVEPGTYRELAVQFGAGEDYMGWAGSAEWMPYQNMMKKAWDRYMLLSKQSDAAPGLLDLARKHLLASAYETGWHDAPDSVHTNPNQKEGAGSTPALWACALASQSRASHVLMEAAQWGADTKRKSKALVSIEDLDKDGHKEVLMRNEVFAVVITPQFGGRIVYGFQYDEHDGVLVIGNPSDDWNWLEQPNDYMDVPANHPGALADVGFEHDRYEIESMQTNPEGDVELVIVNREPNSPAYGLIKRFILSKNSTIHVRYEQIPSDLFPLNLNVGFSPDYLRLLREGRRAVAPFTKGDKRGFRTGSLFAWVRLKSDNVSWGISRNPVFGHGLCLGLGISSSTATLEIGVEILQPDSG
ncbi:MULTISPECIES: hypothetical protein [unclassified Paenibacillus]|uniref:hypothetical protein n=1 Tax=unclassified Paenibacillus TaxID=185978 RepID=UPI001AE7D2CD|nr:MULTISPECIES: hypothetical protein [unclassified Paenibacillus]MBP1155869.1 hypothetical protein [Paenibacillus sp. PvP091]MBP1168745.1 hypothetical protein [Paenibacillus sp. PvR098]MBP2439773.1 hypothetical protein [Paenibacillus sp. PvP052]